MGRFLIVHDFVNKKPLIIAIDSIEALYEEHKSSITMDVDTEEGRKLYESLPNYFTKIEIKGKDIFYPAINSLEDIMSFLITKDIEEIGQNANGEKENDN